MARIATFDFSGAPPAQGGGTDKIPEGRYVLRVTKVEDTKSRTEKRMVSVSLDVAGGAENGKRLRDQFVISGDQKFGRQRLNAFFQALGLAIGEKQVKIDLEKLEGKLVDAVVRDGKIEATDSYPERLISKVDAYYKYQSSNGTAPAAPPAPAPAAEVNVDDLPFEDPIEEVTAPDEDAELVAASETADALLN